MLRHGPRGPASMDAMSATKLISCINGLRTILRPLTGAEISLTPNRTVAMTGSSTQERPVEESIRRKIQDNLNPVHLNVINESYMHNVPKGSETHFKVVVVSDKFDNVSLVQRHRMIHDLLKHELKTGVHALSIQAKTPAQWSEDSEVTPSPKCMGGPK